MTTTIVISCPECKKQIKAPADLRGKKVRCKACGHLFTVPGGAGGAKASPEAKTAPTKKAPAPPQRAAEAKTTAKPPPPPAGAGKPDSDDDVGGYALADPDAPLQEPTPSASAKAAGKSNEPQPGEGVDPYGLTEISLAARCPNCAAEMESEESVICLKCGYNTQTRQLGKLIKAIDHTPAEKFKWLLPGIICATVATILVLFIAFLWLLAERLYAKDQDSTILWLCAALPTQIWGSVIAAAGAFVTGKFAFERLVQDPRPPEKIIRT